MILHCQVWYYGIIKKSQGTKNLALFYLPSGSSLREIMNREQIDYVKKCISTNIHSFYIWSEWLKVRTQVLQMDKFECQDCRKRGKYTKATTVHHNQFLKKYPELALEIFYEFKGKKYRNLVSLCHDCHEARHGYRKKEEKKLLTEERWD